MCSLLRHEHQPFLVSIVDKGAKRKDGGHIFEAVHPLSVPLGTKVGHNNSFLQLLTPTQPGGAVGSHVRFNVSEKALTS